MATIKFGGHELVRDTSRVDQMLMGADSTPWKKEISVDAPLTDESSFWEPIFKAVYDNYEPGTVVIESGDGSRAVFEAGEEVLSSVSGANDIFLKESLYEVKKLRMINPETEQHLFYDIVPNNMGTITIDVGGRYGQTGGTNVAADLIEGAYVEHAYDSRLYWNKYYGLLHRGFLDYTDIVYDGEEEIRELEEQFAPEDEPIADESMLESTFYELSGGAARGKLTDSLGIQWMSSKPPFGARQTNSARKIWVAMNPKDGIAAANKGILKLLAVCDVKFKEGRSKKKVSDFMLMDTGDSNRNIQVINDALIYWDSIITAMESVIATADSGKKASDGDDQGTKKNSPYGDITMKMATKKENERIRELFNVPDAYHSKLIEVDDPFHRERYERYVKARGITVEKELIHGSALENWNSIVVNSIVLDARKLNPNIVIHGKALGNGGYFAMDFAKSNNYVGLASSIHHHGDYSIAVIGVFRTAYGNPMYAVPGKWGTYYDQEFPKSGKDCVHADKAVTGWHMDEVVFFDESAYYLEKLFVYSPDEEELNILPPMLEDEEA